MKPICLEPLSAASSGGSPASMYRAMFSIITIASSTTKPVEIVSAISDRLFRLNPRSTMTPNVPTSESGTATAGMAVAERVRRNRKITITTSATASISSNWTSATELRMVTVRSVSTATCTADGSDACSWGKSRLMRSTTSITLAPGCRWMFRTTAGPVFTQAACRTFSASSITSATSASVTGALLR